MAGYRLVRYVGEAVVPESELERVVGFVEGLFRKYERAVDVDTLRLPAAVLLQDWYTLILVYSTSMHTYYLYLDFAGRRAEVALLAASIEVK